MKNIGKFITWALAIVIFGIPLVIILMIVVSLTFSETIHNFTYKVPKNFEVVEKLHYDWMFGHDGCEASVYRVENFNPQNPDLLNRGFSKFRPYTGDHIYINEKGKDLTFHVNIYIREGGYCVQPSPEWKIFRYLGGGNDGALFSHHKGFKRFLVYDPKTKLLFYLISF